MGSFMQELLVAQAGDETAFLLQAAAWCDRVDNGAAQFGEPFTRERGNAERTGNIRACWQIALVSGNQVLALLLRFFDQPLI